MLMKAAVNRKINLTTKHIIHRKIMMNKVYKSLLFSAAKWDKRCFYSSRELRLNPACDGDYKSYWNVRQRRKQQLNNTATLNCASLWTVAKQGFVWVQCTWWIYHGRQIVVISLYARQRALGIIIDSVIIILTLSSFSNATRTQWIPPQNHNNSYCLS